MTKKVLLFLLLPAVLAGATACRQRPAATAAEVPLLHAPSGAADDEQLPLPSVPTQLREPRQRAAYIVEHFWDAMDFADTVRSHNADFMEQNFSNYLSLFPLVDSTTLHGAVADLMRRAAAESGARRLTAEMADKYLYDPNSPMQNEDFYRLFLDVFLHDATLDEATRSRYAYQLTCIDKNRCGSAAADFAYTDRRGRRHTLYGTAAPRLLLLFFDPDCENCQKTLAHLRHDATLQHLIDEGRAAVLAIYAEGDDEAWQRAKDDIPATWMLGRDASHIEDKELYILRALPALYVLDSEKRVVVKDGSSNEAVSALAQ